MAEVAIVRSKEWTEIETKASKIKDEIQAMMGSMCQEQKDWNLPPLSELFVNAQNNLGRQDFNIVVCGEVKHGKSSLLNAIIGKELLPVNVREATCQVFRITHADKEQFELVFTDGHREPIPREDLARYGSQTEVDIKGEPLFAGRTLRYIDIKTQIACLPEGVHLVDTPGLGATYAAHSAITLEYIKEADAVIFVTDCSAELTVPQLEFLKKIRKITKLILLVQSKIDMVDEDAWNSIKERNQSILAKNYPDENQFMIYPVSSRILLQASDDGLSEKERGYSMEDSFFPDFREALDKLILKTTGIADSASALILVNQYHAEGGQWLDRQKLMLTASSQDEKKQIQEKQNQLVVAYRDECGANGTKRQQVVAQLSQMIRAAQAEVAKITSIDGPVGSHFSDLIKEQTDFQKLNNLYMNMHYLINEAISREWDRVMDTAMTAILQQFTEFNLSVCTNTIPYANIQAKTLEEREISRQVSVPYQEQVTRMVPVTKRVRKQRERGDAYANAGAATGVAIGATVGSIIPFIGTAIGGLLGCGIGAIIGANNDDEASYYYENVHYNEEKVETVTKYRNDVVVEKEGIERNQGIVLSELHRCLAEYRNIICGSQNDQSQLRNFFDQVNTQLLQSLEEQYKSIELRLTHEKTELERQSQLSEEKRTTELALLNKRSEEWRRYESVIVTTNNEITDLEKKLA